MLTEFEGAFVERAQNAMEALDELLSTKGSLTDIAKIHRDFVNNCMFTRIQLQDLLDKISANGGLNG